MFTLVYTCTCISMYLYAHVLGHVHVSMYLCGHELEHVYSHVYNMCLCVRVSLCICMDCIDVLYSYMCTLSVSTWMYVGSCVLTHVYMFVSLNTCVAFHWHVICVSGPSE